MKLSDSFEVSASVDAAWRLLNNIPAVVPCIPGAELTETIGDNSWRALVHVKLGPMALQFATDVTRTQVDAGGHKIELLINARELRGRGAARATINSSLTPANGQTRVDIQTDLTLQGALAQFGRGIVPEVASQLTRQFSDNLAKRIEDGGADDATSQPPVTAAPGLRLAFGALWQRLLRLLQRRR